MIYAIDIGHNCNFDSGAVGIQSENSMVLAVGNALIKKLENSGHEVIRCCPKTAKSTTHSLSQRCASANNGNADVFVSIHANAFNGKAYGTECFALSIAGRAIARRIVDQIAELGFTNRGVKDGGQLYVIKHTAMPAILVETCFCDSQRDMKIFNPEKMAAAIASGLLGSC